MEAVFLHLRNIEQSKIVFQSSMKVWSHIFDKYFVTHCVMCQLWKPKVIFLEQDYSWSKIIYISNVGFDALFQPMWFCNAMNLWFHGKGEMCSAGTQSIPRAVPSLPECSTLSRLYQPKSEEPVSDQGLADRRHSSRSSFPLADISSTSCPDHIKVCS